MRLGLALLALPVVTASTFAATNVVTSPDDDGSIGTLRGCIVAANTNPGPDTIQFNLAEPYVISPRSELPAMTNGATVIDATTQHGWSGSPLVSLLGGHVASGASGLTFASSSNVVRGLAISGYTGGNGIKVAGGVGSAVQGCLLENNGTGIYVAANSTVIGGPDEAERNWICSNTSLGVFFLSCTNSRIENCYIGILADGVTASPNQGYAMVAEAVGGLDVVNSVIDPDGVTGPAITFAIAHGCTVVGCKIGTDASGTLPRSGGVSSGISLLGSDSNRIGGAAAGEPNVIAFNGGGGIRISTDAGRSVGNSVLGNSIFSNGCDGIRLGSVATTNDPGDGDTGPNNLQNWPAVAAAWRGCTIVTGLFNSAASRTYRIEFFANDSGSQGQEFMGATNVTTDGSGNAPFWVYFEKTTTTGKFITATATDLATGDTSEFSPAVQVVAAPDQDGDQMPDYWESQFFGGPTNATAAADGDHDGQPDLDEYIARTCPTNGQDSFRIQKFWHENGSSLTVSTSVERVYTFEYGASPTNWAYLLAVNGINMPVTLSDSTPNVTGRYYRVRASIP